MLALSTTLLAGGCGLLLLLIGRYEIAALGLLAFATVIGTIYSAWWPRRSSDGKAVEYWEDRRDRRWELSRQEAYSRLLATDA